MYGGRAFIKLYELMKMLYKPGFSRGAELEISSENPVIITEDSNDKFKLEIEATLPDGEDVTIPAGTYETGKDFVDAIILGLGNHEWDLDQYVDVEWEGTGTGHIVFTSKDIGVGSFVFIHYPDEEQENAITEIGWEDIEEVVEHSGQATNSDIFHELEMISYNQVRVLGDLGNLWYDQLVSPGSVDDEQIETLHDEWVDLAETFIERDSVTVEEVGNGEIYDENTDYRINYEAGKILAISDGDISDEQDVHVSYDYRDASSSVDLEGHENISIMVRLDNEADIAAYVSPDEDHWYFAEVLTEKLPGGQTGELSVHVNHTLGAKYIRLASADEATIMATVQGKT